MKEIVAEFELIRHHNEEDETLFRGPKYKVLELAKRKLFCLFFKLNTMKVPVSIQYYMVLVAVEGLQLLSLVLNDGSYSKLGPFEDTSPWSLTQSQWFIDLVWLARLDRFLRSSHVAFIFLVCLIGLALLFTIGNGLFLGCLEDQESSRFSFLHRAQKAMVSSLTNVLVIPILDTLCFGAKCSYETSESCLELTQGVLYFIAFLAVLGVYLLVLVICSAMYFDMCPVCGNKMGKPHCRFKLFKLGCYLVVVMCYYFINVQGKGTWYSVVCTLIGVLFCYSYIKYLPYYQTRILSLKLSCAVSFASASACLLISQILHNTSDSSKTISLLYYFQTPCLVQILCYVMFSRFKKVKAKTISELNSPYEVEIKARMLVLDLQSFKENYKQEEMDQEEFDHKVTEMLNEIENIYKEGFKKFPSSEWLYLWSGLVQVHLSQNFILCIVQCMKGYSLANKLDSEYYFYHFKRVSESFYKATIKDDSYDFEMYHKTKNQADAHDEAALQFQFNFWKELESRNPRIKKLNNLAAETVKNIDSAKTNYEKLIKLESENPESIRSYGYFLSNFSNCYEQGQRLVTKAQHMEESKTKNVNTSAVKSIHQPLSFFDKNSAIIYVSGDPETTGEIIQVNAEASKILKYNSGELVGRNISVIIPSPFSERHDEYMKGFYENSNYTVLNVNGLILYFCDKNQNILEAHLIVRMIPRVGDFPCFLVLIKETKPIYDIMLLKEDLVVSGWSKNCESLFQLEGLKRNHSKIIYIFKDFEDLKSQMLTKEGAELVYTNETRSSSLELRLVLSSFPIGAQKVSVLKIYNSALEDPVQPTKLNKPTADEDRKLSISENFEQYDSKKCLTFDGRINRSSSSEESEPDVIIAQDSSKEEFKFEEILPQTQNNSLESEESESISMSSYQESVTQEDPSEEPKKEDVSENSFEEQNSESFSQESFSRMLNSLTILKLAEIKSNVFRLKFSLLFTYIVLIATSLITFQVISDSMNGNDYLSEVIQYIGDLRLYAQSEAYYSRMVSLMSEGTVPDTLKDQYFDWIIEDSQSIHDYFCKLYSDYETLSVEEKKVYTEKLITVWHLFENEVSKHQDNLFIAISNLFMHSYVLEEQFRNQVVPLNERNTIYLFRNGNGDTLEYINKSTEFYVEKTKSNLVTQRNTALGFVVGSVVILFISAGISIAPAIYKLEKTKQEGWELFVEIPSYVCRYMETKCSDKLKLIDESNIDLDQPEEQKDSGSQKLLKKKKSSAKRSKPYEPRHRKILILKISVFFFMSIIYFYLIYYIGFQAAEKKLLNQPARINWGSRRRHLSRALNMWVTEAVFENVTDIGYKYTIPHKQNVGSPFELAMKVLNELEYVENGFIFGNEEQGLEFARTQSEEHDDLLFKDACVTQPKRSKQDCQTIGDNLMGQGLHSALNAYTSLAKDLLLKIASSKITTSEAAKLILESPDMKLLQDLDNHYLYDSIERSSELIISDFSKYEDNLKLMQNLVLVFYVIISMGFFVVVYKPMIDKIGFESRNVWSLCFLLPFEYQEDFEKLNSMIKLNQEKLN